MQALKRGVKIGLRKPVRIAASAVAIGTLRKKSFCNTMSTGLHNHWAGT